MIQPAPSRVVFVRTAALYYCVIQIHDLRLLYTGEEEARAAELLEAYDAARGAGETRGDAQCQAAMEAGRCLRDRNARLKRVGPH